MHFNNYNNLTILDKIAHHQSISIKFVLNNLENCNKYLKNRKMS